MLREERIREIEERILVLEPIVDGQAMRQTRPEPTSLEMDELDRLKKELARLKGKK
jgi:hypothetical protein